MTENPPPYEANPVGQPQMSPSDEKLWALLAHIGPVVLGFIAPLIVLLVKGNESRFVRHHAMEALNFQITVLIAVIVSAFLIIVLIGFVLLPIVTVGALVFMVVAAVQANNGAWYKYPVSWRLLT